MGVPHGETSPTERFWAELNMRRIGLFIAAAGMAAAAVAPTVSAHDQRGPVVTHLAEFGSDDFVTGSTIGPDGALYVTDGKRR
jgi:hypothetical protein